MVWRVPEVYCRLSPRFSSGCLGAWKKERAGASMAPLAVKFPGISEDLCKMAEENLDEAPARRRLHRAFKDIQLSLDHMLFKVPTNSMTIEESYFTLSRGSEVFTKQWLPATPPKAAVFFCHGYGDTCTFFVEGTARNLALSGYGVYAIDYPGFGLSDGLHGYIPSFDSLVDDVAEAFTKLRENKALGSLPCFLFGQSMGGAIALKVHLKQPNAWNGAILVAPMCKIADSMVPPWPMKELLTGLAYLFPKLKLVPQNDLAVASFRDPRKRSLTAYNVLAYKDKPRLYTALEMLRATEEIESRLNEVSLPLLILHGERDVVTDPSVSKALYEEAVSSDKKLTLYKDCFHALLEGEPDDVILQVLKDIVSWLDDHCQN